MQVDLGRAFIGRLPTDGDLLEALYSVCQEKNIRLGIFSVIGALRSVKLGYYDQQLQKYVESVRLEGKFEISVCTGNISLKDEDVFVHAHITLGDQDGKAFAGHLMPGAVIFAAEYFIQELRGPDMTRSYDDQTGLSLWNMPG